MYTFELQIEKNRYFKNILAQFDKVLLIFTCLLAFKANSSAQNFQSETLPVQKKFLLDGLAQIKFSYYSDFQFGQCVLFFFLAFFHFVRTSLLHLVSATKKSLVGHKKGVFLPFL